MYANIIKPGCDEPLLLFFLLMTIHAGTIDMEVYSMTKIKCV